MKEIYKDDNRTLYVEGGTLIMAGATTRSASLSGIETSSAVDKKIQSALKKRGENPSNWFSVIVRRDGRFGGATVAVLPRACRPAIDAAIKKYERSINEYRARPEVAERERVNKLFLSAERLKNYPGDYYPALRAAEKDLAAWREKYPAAAREEDRVALLSKAARLEDVARGALTYDADGWLSSADQQARHDELMAKASAIRQKAEELKKEGEK